MQKRLINAEFIIGFASVFLLVIILFSVGMMFVG